MSDRYGVSTLLFQQAAPKERKNPESVITIDRNSQMTHEDLEKRLTDLVQAAREGGLSNEAVIEVLLDHVEALREGLT